MLELSQLKSTYKTWQQKKQQTNIAYIQIMDHEMHTNTRNNIKRKLPTLGKV